MKLIFGLLLFFSIISTNAYSQWSKLPGPAGGVFSDIERVGNEIWLSSISGLYISQNEGLTWHKSNLVDRYVHDVIAFNDTIVVLFATIDVNGNFNYKNKTISSFNGGSSWQAPFLFNQGNLTGDKIFKSSKCLFIEMIGGYRQSFDGGLTWSTMSLYLSRLLSDSNMALGIDYSGNPDKYYFSEKGDTTWNLVYSGNYSSTFKIYNECLFITDRDTTLQLTKLMKSCDLGATWSISIADTHQIGNTNFINLNDTLYLYIYPSAPLMSIDNGDTWISGTWPNYNLIYPGVNTLIGNRVLLGIYSNLYTYVPSQNILLPTNTGTTAQYTNCLYSNNDVLFAGTRSSFFKSVNGGQSWKTILDQSVVKMCFDGDSIYGLTYDSPSTLMRSYNNGQTWDSITVPYSASGPTRTSIAKVSSQIFISSKHESIFSSDEGLTWDTLPDLPNISLNGCYLNSNSGGLLSSCFGQLFAMSKDGYIFKYNTTSQSWQTLSNFCNASGYNTDQLFSSGNKLYAKISNDFYFSIDSGLTWIVGSGNAPNAILDYAGILFGVSGIDQVVYSLDEGVSWQKLDTDSTFISYRNLCVLNGVFYADGFYDGIYRRSNPLFSLSGNVYLDQNNDGIKNSGEPGLQQLIVATTPAGIGTTINSSGDYSLITDMPGTISAVSPNPFITINPPSYTFSGETDSLDFGVYLPPNIFDLKADITNTNVFNPGFSTNLQLTIKNYGNYSANPQAKMLLDTNLLYVNATPSPNYFSGDTAIWNLAPLNFLEQASIQVEVQTILQTLLGSFVTAKLEAWPVIGDTLPFDNFASLRAEVVGSFDPNDKTCLQGNIFTPAELQSNSPLEYVIRFQNKGSFPTAFVLITDTLSSLLDFTTFRMISSSHPCSWSINGFGILVLTFNPLALPPEATDPLNSHGFFKYSIKCKSGISIGSAIDNSASIVFDFNLPIFTNTVTTLISDTIPLQIPEMVPSIVHLAPYPNPARDKIFIKNLNIARGETIVAQTFNIQGKLISVEVINTNSANIDISEMRNGLYFTRLFSEGGKNLGTFKFIKE